MKHTSRGVIESLAILATAAFLATWAVAQPGDPATKWCRIYCNGVLLGETECPSETTCCEYGNCASGLYAGACCIDWHNCRQGQIGGTAYAYCEFEG